MIFRKRCVYFEHDGCSSLFRYILVNCFSCTPLPFVVRNVITSGMFGKTGKTAMLLALAAKVELGTITMLPKP